MVRKDKEFTRDVQMIFQDNMASLDPKKRVIDIIAEPLRNFEKMTVTEERKKSFRTFRYSWYAGRCTI